MNLLESTFGANWRTTLSGIGTGMMGLLAALAAAPYEMGSISTVFPDKWKTWIALTGAGAAFVLHVINSALQKDKQVVGNGTPFDPFKVPTGDGGSRKIIPIIFLALMPGLLLMGCVTGADGKRHLTPGASAALSRLGQDTLTIGENALSGAASGAISNAAAQGMSSQQFDSAALQAAAMSGAFNGAALGVRTLETQRTGPPPTAETIQQAIASTGGPAMPSSVTAGVSGAVVAAVAQGVPVNAALEKAAVSLDTVAAKVPPAALAAP